jgi:MFS family permease
MLSPTPAAASATTALPQAPLRSAGYRRYVLGLLFFVYTCSLLDRMIVSILQESIKKELALSDTQLGVLTGFAFALFFATLGIPIARWADRTLRTRIIIVSLSLWSLMTALSGLAASFTALLLFRVGVSVGEAGCTPAAHSIISDYFARDRRGTAISVYSLGGPIGVLIGVMTAGWLNQIVGWRQAFILVGVPGLLLAIIVHLTLREPQRGLSDHDAEPARSDKHAAHPAEHAAHPAEHAAHPAEHAARAGEPAPSSKHVGVPIGELARVMWACRPFRYIAFSYTVLSIASNAIVNWNPPFYARAHGLASGRIGVALALVYALPLAAGTLLGGYLGDRLARRDARWYLWLPALTVFVAYPMSFAQYNLASASASFACCVIPAFAIGMYMGPCFGVAQMLVPVSMRAMASAVLLLLASVLGVGLGPVLTGVLSDLLSHTHGARSLGWALSLVSFTFIPGGILLLLAARGLPAWLTHLKVT